MSDVFAPPSAGSAAAARPIGLTDALPGLGLMLIAQLLGLCIGNVFLPMLPVLHAGGAFVGGFASGRMQAARGALGALDMLRLGIPVLLVSAALDFVTAGALMAAVAESTLEDAIVAVVLVAAVTGGLALLHAVLHLPGIYAGYATSRRVRGD